MLNNSIELMIYITAYSCRQPSPGDDINAKYWACAAVLAFRENKENPKETEINEMFHWIKENWSRIK